MIIMSMKFLLTTELFWAGMKTPLCVGDRADDLITAKTSERKNVGGNYLQLLSATKRKLTRVSNFNMSKMRGWRHKRRVWDCNT